MKIIGVLVLIIVFLLHFTREEKRTLMESLYEKNTEFREYVDKYAHSRGISVEAALRHKIVMIVAKDKFNYGV